MRAAIDAKVGTPNAMTLATVDDRCRPAARIVILKDIDDRGFSFFTNYESPKRKVLAAHAVAALVMYWEPMQRQVRVEGTVDRLSAEESNAYFATRPRESQIGAIASPQSQVLADRAELQRPSSREPRGDVGNGGTGGRDRCHSLRCAVPPGGSGRRFYCR